MLRGPDLPRAFLAIGSDAFKQFAGRFGVRVLSDEPACECVAQDALPQRLRALQFRLEVIFKVLDHGELVFDGFDDGFLLFQWGERNRDTFRVGNVEVGLRR
jgi:hypothetical protein